MADGNGSGFWQKPTAGKEKPFQHNSYGYFCVWESGEYLYWGTDINEDYISASTVGLNIDKLKYIWGGNTEENCYNAYLVASRSVYVGSEEVGFGVARVGGGEVGTNAYNLCYSIYGDAEAYDNINYGSLGVRPVVVLPSSLLVENKGNETYDLAD